MIPLAYPIMLVCSVLLTYWLLKDSRYIYTDEVVLINLTIISIMLAVIFIASLMLAGAGFGELKTTRVEKLNALEGVSGSGGSFFLGTGSFEGTMYYYYLTNASEGEKIKKTKAEDSIIHGIAKNPRIEEKTHKFGGTLGLFLGGIPKTETHIYLPDNSIKRMYRPEPFTTE